jgi:electron transfer flavoprotein alpha subunit
MGEPQIWVFIEQRRHVVHDVGLELLGKARELADQAGARVAALLLGDSVTPLADTLISFGADMVLVADHPALEPYRLLPYTQVLAEACRGRQPDIMLIVPGWGGGVVATIKTPEHRPQMATVMPGVMKKPQPAPRSGQVIPVTIGEDLDLSGPQVLEVHREEPQELPLETAEVVVAGGFGVGGPEGWKLLEELARLLGGAVGATRPPVDEGWAAEEQMIGQSGKTVRPRLYIGVGISGMSHHVVGMDEADFVVAINTDPKAPIFEVADLAIVGDQREIIPLLLEELHERGKGS